MNVRQMDATTGTADSVLEELETHEIVTGPLVAVTNQWSGYDVFTTVAGNKVWTRYVRVFHEDPEGDIKIVVLDLNGVSYQRASFSGDIHESAIATFVASLIASL